MIDINELREAIQTFGSQVINEYDLNELLDRLEAAEKAVTEAYQRGYATGQEEIEKERDALRAKISDLTIGIEYLSNLNNSYKELIGELQDERDTLRARIEQMERQEPVAWYYVTNGAWDCYSRERPPEDAYDAGSLMALYALPGAQNAPSIPDGWKLVPIEPTKEIQL